MNKKTASIIFNVLKIIISIIICICTAASMLGATLINVGRNYINSEDFKTQVQTTDLSTVKFIVGSEKTTVNEYVKDSATDYIESKNKYFFTFANKAVDQILSSDFINRVVKDEALYLADFFINSDSKAAQDRLDNNESIDTVLELKPANAKSIEEAARIFIRSFVITSIEKTAKMPADKFIVFLSQETVTKLVVLSIVLLISLIAINYKSILNVILYSGIASTICYIVITSFQNKFEKINAGAEDLVGYVFLKPLADSYTTNARIALVAGLILIAIFIACLFIFGKNKQEKTEKAE